MSDRHQTPDRNLNAVVALASAGNQMKLDWAGKLGLGPVLFIFVTVYIAVGPVIRMCCVIRIVC